MHIDTPRIPHCLQCQLPGSWVGSSYRCLQCKKDLSNDPSGGPLAQPNPPTRDEIVEYAMSWMGVKYLHQGRSRENGVDCIGLLRAVADQFALSNHDFFNYAPTPDGRTLIAELDKAFGVTDGHSGHYDGTPYRHGDVLTFWIRKRTKPKHAAIYIDLPGGRPGIIHTYSTVKKVCKNELSPWWRDRICKVYKWPGVD